MPQLKPLGYKVLVKPEEIQEMTAGGIAIPPPLLERMQKAGKRGTIIAKGPDVAYGLQNVPIGATVWYKKYSGDELWVGTNEDNKYLVLLDEDISAVEVENG